jgi:beta-glucosidase
MDATKPIDARVNDLLSRMTIEEKIALVHGNSKFTTAGIPRLGIPVRWLSDGPHGVREDIGPDTWAPMGHTDDFSTCMPCGSALAATWDMNIAQLEGQTIGEEARERGKQIMLGPAVNIQRTPLGGRNFEYMGEDPLLAGTMASAYIKGVQSQQVASCVKHFACNNQETNRNRIDVNVDERTLREIYLPAFEMAVHQGGALAVMAAYNKINGEFCAENSYLLNTILKGQWGFKGLVMSDWAAAHDTQGAVLGGLDLEMGTDKPYDQFYLANPFLEGLQDGTYAMSLLDDKARRNLYVYFASGAMDERRPAQINTKAHQTTSRMVAEEATVLLKNDGALLPLDEKAIKTIAVIGNNATLKQCAGGDSSGVKAFYEITPLEGITRRVGRSMNVIFSQGYAPPPARGGGRGAPSTRPAPDAQELIDRAVSAARAADVAILVCGNDHSATGDTEGSDRPSLELSYGQDELIRQVTAANPRTVVVLVAGTPVAMPWIEQAPAVLQSWFGGMEGGDALAAILFGDVNPSGKLPCTFPKKLADSPAHAMGNFPGDGASVHYAEGLLVGYRWYDTMSIEPLFPFGFGLSYTQFDYGDLKVAKATGDDAVATAQFQLTNSGRRRGAEVAQVYVQPVHSHLPRPKQELKGFARVQLDSTESREVTIPLNARAFAYFDPDRKAWVAEAGDYTIAVGSSSRDVRLKASFQLDQEIVMKP